MLAASFGKVVMFETMEVPEVLSLSLVLLLIKILVKLYSLSFISIPSINLEVLITCALLAFLRHLCQIQIFLFLLTRYIDLSFLFVIARFLLSWFLALLDQE